MRLLWYGESPFIETGAGQVAKHLLPVFQELFEEIHIVAINQWWEQRDLPPGVSLTLCTTDMCFNEENAKKVIAAGDYDVLFLTTDMNRIKDLQEQVQMAVDRDIPIIMYAAMDTHIYTRSFWSILELATVPVVFTNWNVRQCRLILPALADKLRVIYHGCEPDVFYPLPTDERDRVRATMFGMIDRSKFLAINVNRNQVRKDLMRTMAAFHLFHLKHPDSVLYLHAKHRDLGGNIIGQAEYLGMDVHGKNPEIIFSPENYHELTGVSREDLNNIYNAADVSMSTSTGEGWGLTTTESMAAGTPFIGPNNTVFPEILGDGKRGLLVESGGPDLWATFYGVSDTPREICSTTGMAAALEEVYQDRAAAHQRAISARAWTEQHTWSMVQNQWREVLYGVKTGLFRENYSA